MSVGNERVSMERVMIDGVGAYFRHELPIVSSGLAPISRTVSKGHNLVQLGFKVNGAEIVKTGVQSGAVVEGFDVIEDGGTSSGVGREALMINQLVFESAPEVGSTAAAGTPQLQRLLLVLIGIAPFAASWLP